MKLTAKMKKISLKRLVLLIVTFLAVFFAASFSCEFLPTSAATYSSAKAMCVMEAGSGRVLYSKNSHQKLAMASTTKIMTAITAIENCKDLDETFVISPKAVGVPGTSLYLKNGESFSTRQLLYGLMLISGNDASVAIGEHVGGSVAKFVEMMNSLASSIGATNTHFDNTHGLDSKTHYTTAEDLAKITSYAMQNETFCEIVSTKNTKIVSGEGKTRYLKNKNKLLNSLQGCDGVKTGFTDDAGRCLVSSCQRDGMRLVCVVLNCGPMFEESRALLEKGFEEYHLYNLSRFFTFAGSIKVEQSKKDVARLAFDQDAYYPLKMSELDQVKVICSLPNSVTAPLSKGEKVGEFSIFLGKDLLFSKNIYTIEDVRSNTVSDNFKDIVENW